MYFAVIIEFRDIYLRTAQHHHASHVKSDILQTLRKQTVNNAMMDITHRLQGQSALNALTTLTHLLIIRIACQKCI